MSYYKTTRTTASIMAAAHTAITEATPPEEPVQARVSPTAPLSTLLDPRHADHRTTSSSVTLYEIWRASTIDQPSSRPSIALAAIWPLDHDKVVEPLARLVAASAPAPGENGRNQSVTPTDFTLKRMDERFETQLLAPLKAIAAASGHPIRVHLGDKPLTKIPTITIDPNGSIKAQSLMVADPITRMKVASEEIGSYPKTDFASIAAALATPTERTLPAELAQQIYSWRSLRDAQPETKPLSFTDNHWLNTPDKLIGIPDEAGETHNRRPTEKETAAYLAHSIYARAANNDDFLTRLGDLTSGPVAAQTLAEAAVIKAARDAAITLDKEGPTPAPALHTIIAYNDKSLSSSFEHAQLTTEHILARGGVKDTLKSPLDMAQKAGVDMSHFAKHYPSVYDGETVPRTTAERRERFLSNFSANLDIYAKHGLIEKTNAAAKSHVNSMFTPRTSPERARALDIGISFDSTKVAAATLKIDFNAMVDFHIERKDGQQLAVLSFPPSSGLEALTSNPIEPGHASRYPQAGKILSHTLLSQANATPAVAMMLPPQMIATDTQPVLTQGRAR